MLTAQSIDAEGFILAGGHSSRMGSDKALVLFGGIPLVRVALNTFAEAGLSARIAGSRSALGAFAEEVPDAFPESGPMGGIHAGLRVSRAEWNLFLPVDLPLMPSSLLACMMRRALLTGAPVTVARLSGRMEPFPVVLHTDILPHIARRLEEGSSACHKAWRTIPEELGRFLDAVSVESLIQCGHCRHPLGLPPVLWFQSTNSPSELAQLNRIFAKRSSICA
ncbi:molybdenum cofactor guanylyltransferase [Acidicapsa acidisoli]|uniref:molybdenum cofactor guanylyltransferase n=1 Tax=Acidicapsa acidisoli TaxID=1615681 RepID=UPI0021E0380F|nr:molybdenum cofactor guanylyltransferase [Acidicapsa acidisoli]